MSHFGWNPWKRLHAAQAAKLLPHGLEREALKYLHRATSLRVLARRLAPSFVGFRVYVESIWIDGTPQATFTDVAGNEDNCELADLLLIFRKETPAAVVIEERAMLLQAKITAKYNKLSSGKSTKKERQLLEQVDRNLAIALHRDTARTSLIGHYVFGPAGTVAAGLKDCARYLLAPKGPNWAVGNKSRAPFQVGWPQFPKPKLRSPCSFVESILKLSITKTAGRDVLAGVDDWSQMVSDLKGDYAGKFMSGYRHDRISVGSAFMTAPDPRASSTSFQISGSGNPLMSVHRSEEFKRPPAIPIITVIIREGAREDEDDIGGEYLWDLLWDTNMGWLW